MILARPMESTSYTALLSAVSPMLGGSPVSAMMLRTPNACAPIRSAWSPISERSRVVRWRIVSMPTCCWIRTHNASAPMRTRAMGLSATLTASAPWALATAAPSSIFAALKPRGGSTSTLTTNLPAASFCSRPVGSGAVSSAASITAALTRTMGRGASASCSPAACRPAVRSISARMAWMCAGVVPQHPPISVTPCARNDGTCSAK